MIEKRCSTCGARYMTAHATNCPMYLANKDAIISEQQARIDELESQIKAVDALYSEAFKRTGGVLAREQIVKMLDERASAIASQQARIDELEAELQGYRRRGKAWEEFLTTDPKLETEIDALCAKALESDN